MIIYLAGGETWWERFRDAQIRNQLFSFFYLRRSRGMTKVIDALYAQREYWKERGKPFRLFLDSGAFTLQGTCAKAPKKPKLHNWEGKRCTWCGKDKPNVATYFNEFKAFVKTTGDLWTVVAELDIDEANLDISLEQVEEWRDELWLVRGQAHILPVWHESRGMAKWMQYVADERFPYLAFGSRLASIAVKNRLSAMAHRAGKMVHGFAETKIQTDIRLLKCDSVDSSTWLRATKYGGLFIFQGNQFRVLDHKHKDDRKRFTGYFKANGLRYEIIRKDETKIPPDSPEYTEYQEELTKCSLVAWRLLSDRYESMGRHKDVDSSLQRDVPSSTESRGRALAVATEYAGPDSNEDQREQPGGTVMARVRGTSSDTDGSQRNRFRIVRAASKPGPSGAPQGSNESSALDSADGSAGDDEELQDVPLETIVTEQPPEFPGDRHVRITLKRLPGGKLLMADCTTSVQTNPEKVPAYGSEAVLPKPIVAKAPPHPRLPAAHEHARMKGDILLPIPNERERNDKSEGLGNSPNRFHASEDEIAQIMAHYAYHNYPPISREIAVMQHDLLRMIRTGRYKQLQEEGSPDVMPLPNCECGHPKAKHEGGNGRCDHDSRDSQGSVMFACLCTAYQPKQVCPTCRETYPFIERGFHELDSTGQRKCRPITLNSSEPGYERTAEGAAQEVVMADRIFCRTCKHEQHFHGGGGKGWCRACEDYQKNHDSLARICDAFILDPAHVDKPATLPPVATSRAEANQVPSEQKGTVTMTIEGRKHLPVVGLESSISHAPDIQAGLDALNELPGLACNECPAQGQCKEYEADALCFFEAAFAKLKVRDTRSHLAMREHLLQQDWSRMQRGLLFERLVGGGMPDPRVSQQLASFRAHLAEFQDLQRVKVPPPTMTASVTLTGDRAVSAGPGVLTQLFGGAMRATELEIDNAPGRDLDILDAPVSSEKDVPK